MAKRTFWTGRMMGKMGGMPVLSGHARPAAAVVAHSAARVARVSLVALLYALVALLDALVALLGELAAALAHGVDVVLEGQQEVILEHHGMGVHDAQPAKGAVHAVALVQQVKRLQRDQGGVVLEESLGELPVPYGQVLPHARGVTVAAHKVDV